MANKIIGGVGKLLGIGKKKAATTAAAPAAEQKGPIIKPLGSTPSLAPTLRRRIASGAPGLFGQSDKLGG